MFSHPAEKFEIKKTGVGGTSIYLIEKPCVAKRKFHKINNLRFVIASKTSPWRLVPPKPVSFAHPLDAAPYLFHPALPVREGMYTGD